MHLHLIYTQAMQSLWLSNKSSFGPENKHMKYTTFKYTVKFITKKPSLTILYIFNRSSMMTSSSQSASTLTFLTLSVTFLTPIIIKLLSASHVPHPPCHYYKIINKLPCIVSRSV